MLKPKFPSYSKLRDQGPYLFSALRQLVFRENGYYPFLGARVSKKTLVSLCWSNIDIKMQSDFAWIDTVRYE